MKDLTSMTLAAALASLALLGAGSAVAQVPGDEDDRGALVTDPVVGGDDEHPAGKSMPGIYAAELIGQTVQNRRSGDEVGKVSNLVIDKAGNVVAILVQRSDRKSAGQRAVAFDWDQMDRAVKGDEITLTIDMDEDALEALPEYAHM